MRKKWTLVFWLAAFALLPLLVTVDKVQANADVQVTYKLRETGESKYVPGEVLVKFKNANTPAPAPEMPANECFRPLMGAAVAKSAT